MDDAALRALEAVEQEESTLLAKLEAGAARLSIDTRDSASVLLNGAALPAGPTACAVTEPLVISVAMT